MGKENKKKSGNTKKSESLQEMTELLKRTQANFENYRKQNQKHNEEIRKMAAKDVLLQILPVIDNFELALKNVDTNKNQKDFVQGVEIIYSQLLAILKDNNVKEIETKDQKFDPHCHEALMKVESELAENMIVEVFQKGFILNEKVLRHAKVKVSSRKKNINGDKKNDRK